MMTLSVRVAAVVLTLCATTVLAWQKVPSRSGDGGRHWHRRPTKWGRGEFVRLIPGFAIPGVRMRPFVDDGRFPDFGYLGKPDRVGFWQRNKFVPAKTYKGYRRDKDGTPGFLVSSARNSFLSYRRFRREISKEVHYRRHKDFKIQGMDPIAIDFRHGVPPFYVEGGNLEIPGFTTNGLFPAMKYIRGEPKFLIGGKQWINAYRFKGFKDRGKVGGFVINGREVPYQKLKSFLDGWFAGGKDFGDLKIEGFTISGRPKRGFWPGFTVKKLEIPGFAPQGRFPQFEWRNNVPGFVIEGTFTPAKKFPGFRLDKDEPGFEFKGDWIRYDGLKAELDSYDTNNLADIASAIPGFTIEATGTVDFPGFMVKDGVPGFNLNGKFYPGFSFPGFDLLGDTPGFNIDEEFVPLNEIPEFYPDFKLPKAETTDGSADLTADEQKDVTGEAPTFDNGITASTGEISVRPSVGPTEVAEFPGFKVQNGVPGIIVDGKFLDGKKISNFNMQGGLPGFTINGEFVQLAEVLIKYPNFHIELTAPDVKPVPDFQNGYIGLVIEGKFIPGNEFPGLKPTSPWPQVKVPGFKIPGYESEVPEFTIRDFQPGFLVEGGEKFIPGVQVPGYKMDGLNIELEGAQIPPFSFPGFSFTMGLPAVGVP